MSNEASETKPTAPPGVTDEMRVRLDSRVAERLDILSHLRDIVGRIIPTVEANTRPADGADDTGRKQVLEAMGVLMERLFTSIEEGQHYRPNYRRFGVPVEGKPQVVGLTPEECGKKGA
jgi:hypothetical protein